MVVKNITNKLQKLQVEPLLGGDTYDIYVEPHGTTDIERAVIVDQRDLTSLFDVEGLRETAPISLLPEETTPQEEVKTVDEPAPDNFTCDICGAEFASARGLSSHKVRSHAES